MNIDELLPPAHELYDYGIYMPLPAIQETARGQCYHLARLSLGHCTLF